MDLPKGDAWFMAWLCFQTTCMQWTEAFIVDTNDVYCDFYHACYCSKTQINCNNKNLATVPDMTPLDPMGYMSTNYYIHLSGNKFTTVSANTFNNFSNVTVLRISLYLDSNKISTISDNAFNGIENKVGFLSLQYNDLTILPRAVGQLTALKKLYLFQNPIITLDDNVMSAIGKTLTSLWIGMDSFATWPTELELLQHLNTLVLERIPSDQFLPAGAFRGLGNSLTNLQLLWSNLTRLPTVVCDIKNLAKLAYNNNAKQDADVDLFSPCMHGLTKLGHISLDNSQITNFPNVLVLLPWAKYISLKYNNIFSIDSKLIPVENDITSFYIQHNQLSSIPTALRNLEQVRDLRLSYNHIATVGVNDLSGLSSLSNLALDHNPIRVISTGAFRSTPALANLDVQCTNIKAIPSDVLDLPKLKYLHLLETSVVCNCSMAYLKDWEVHVKNMYYFTGFCNDDIHAPSVKNYIIGDLQNCDAHWPESN